ncbi:MAG: DUF4199 domain-containing protein [Muribaculaceae bacterium]|nr:DUF4199 domain-containing protein [Muribaculaceae bacterium]
MNKESTSTGVYRRGASDGALMGLVLCALFASWALSMRMAVASLAFPLLLLAVPVLAFVQLRRGYRADLGTSTFSALWMHGICTFFFGTLLMAALAIVWLRWWEPGLIGESLRSAADVYASLGSPEAQKMAADVRALLDKGLAPRPVDIGLSLMWAGVFSGSILSMIYAGIIRTLGYRPRNQKK